MVQTRSPTRRAWKPASPSALTVHCNLVRLSWACLENGWQQGVQRGTVGQASVERGQQEMEEIRPDGQRNLFNKAGAARL